MSTQMFFVLNQAENVPLVSVSALGQRMPELDNADGAAYAVEVLQGASLESRIVHVGLMDRRQAEIRKGARPGERLLVQAKTPPPRQQRPGGFGPRI